jgi:hypothetical protein
MNEEQNCIDNLGEAKDSQSAMIGRPSVEVSARMIDLGRSHDDAVFNKPHCCHPRAVTLKAPNCPCVPLVPSLTFAA